MNKWHKALIIVSLIVFIVAVVLNLIFFKKKDDNKKDDKVADTDIDLVEEINNSTGGTIAKDGFEITYDSGLDLTTLFITKEPYEEYRKKALDYLRSQGTDPCKINYTTTVPRGMPQPKNLDEGNRCNE